MNFGHFWAPSPSTFHNVKNHGGGGAEEEPGGIAGNEEQVKTKKNRGTTKKDTGGGTNNTVHVLGKAGDVFTKTRLTPFQVFRCVG